jgi:methylated-DNA-protein-cysteine methyltransferase related protein
MSEFSERVYTVVQHIPKGRVVSYGQVALYAGVPRAARQVGWTLNRSEGKVDMPWWRVINNAGKITIKGTRYNDAEIQRKLLQNEGIVVDENFDLDIEKYRFIAEESWFRKLGLDKPYKTHTNVPINKSPRR